MTKVSAAVMERFAEDYKVLSLPYIFESKEHYFAVCDGDIGKQILQSSEKKWLKGMCFYDAGSRSFYTKSKLIEKPEDLSGMKIRVMQSQTAMEMVSALGGSPTPLSWGELYTALQSNVVDGAENNPPTFVDSRHYEVCKYYSLDEHASIPDVLILGLPVWNSLSENEQAILQQAIDESVVLERKLWNEAEESAFETLKAAGVKIHHPDKSAFFEKAQLVYKPYLKDPILNPYIQQIGNLKNQ
jgi:tripartite ATP-independent transporter DctP family solute receptor